MLISFEKKAQHSETVAVELVATISQNVLGMAFALVDESTFPEETGRQILGRRTKLAGRETGAEAGLAEIQVDAREGGDE